MNSFLQSTSAPRGPRSDKHFACNETRKVRHVDHEHGAALVRDLAEPFEIDLAWVSGKACKQNERLYFHRLFFDRVVVEQSAFFIDRVRNAFEHLCRNVHAVSVREVSARIIIETHEALPPESFAQFFPLRSRQIGHAFYAE